MLTDSHCHLDAAEFDADRDAVYAAALLAGVKRIVVPSVAVDGFKRVKTSVARYPGCVAAYGIHPLFVMPAKETDLAVLRDWLVKEKPVAVGEIGLDFYGAPGRAHILGGASPLLARQGEELAERQGCRGRLRI